MKLAFISTFALFAALALSAQDDPNSTTSTTTSSGSTVVVNGKTNGIVIRKSVINGQPVDVDVQVIGDGASGDLGAQIAAQVRAATQNALSAAGGAVDGLAQGFAFAFDDKDGFTWAGMPGRKSTDRAVVVSVTPMDAKTRAEWQEDLNVMARLLEKAAIQSASGAKAHAMGIQLMTFGGRPAPHFYLDGYGAVIQINAAFPLVAPAKQTAEKKTDSDDGSAWDKARRELYGQRATGPSISMRIDGRDPLRAGGEYDAARVEKLVAALLEALKEAKNFRHLRRDESITVIVTGPGEGRNGSTLTLTAKKSAVDDLAKGKLSVEEFRKKNPAVIY